MMSVRIALIFAGLALSAAPLSAQTDPVVPQFTEETATAGITHTFTGEWEQMVGGGVATFDCDADGLTDALLTGGTVPSVLFRNTSADGGPLSFVPVSDSGADQTGVSGAYPLDIDSDGITDIVLLRVGENLVLRGLGDCRFEPANAAWGFDGGDAWSTAFAATWERGSDWPTIAIGNYINRTEEAFPWGSCTDNWLHRGGNGGFAPPVPLTPSFCALSILFTDWNRSGTPSLRVSNDREYYKGGTEQMWHLEPGQAPRLYTADEGWKTLKIWGMGIASTDVNFDGYPDYFLTSMADNKLQTLASVPADGNPAATFADVAFAKGAHAQRPFIGDDLNPSTAWHAQFEDVNNDGLADLFIAKGNVWEMPDFALRDPDNLLVQRADGTFMETADKAGVASMATGRGGALADFNRDGLMDLLVVNRNEPAQIWRNTTQGAGGWIGYQLDQPGANRQAVGAFVEVRTGERVQTREITSGGGHVSGHAGWWHAGIGAQTTADVRVIWPDGQEGPWQTVQAGAFYTLARDAEPVRP